jgi:predicted small lipoprotein YifL
MAITDEFNYMEWQSKELSKYAFPGRMMGMIGNIEQEIPIKGMTKREVFAMAAMQGMLAACGNQGTLQFEDEAIASNAISVADELLKQLNNH